LAESKILVGSATEAPVASASQPAPDLSKSEKFLKSLFAKASEKGYTPTQLVSQCMKIDHLEKKYSKSFDELKNEFDQLAKEISARSKKVKELEESISEVQKKKAALMREYSVDEKRVREYIDARAQLSSIGFAIDDLSSVKTCLFSMKGENYSPEQVVGKLNAIGDLEQRKSALESELSAANGDLREKKALLIQLRQMQQSGLSIDQMERIRDIVSKISSRRGINPDQALNRFENDVLKNYDLTLGLESEVMRLQETKNSISTEFDERRKSLESKEKGLLEKLAEQEKKYQANKSEIQAYSELRAIGIDGARLASWHQLLSDNKLDFGVIESELKKQGSLKTLEEAALRKVQELEDKQRVLESSLSDLADQKRVLESSLVSIKDGAIKELESTRSLLLASLSQMTEEMKKTSDFAKNDLVETVSGLKTTAAGFSGDLTSILQKAQEDMKKQAELLETAERIGKYEAVLPLLKLNDNGNVSETEALVTMWNVSNIFIQWFEKQANTTTRAEILAQLKKTLASLNQEIQTVGP
jgi:uncharacterized coiled-coil DUF342 family protein